MGKDWLRLRPAQPGLAIFPAVPSSQRVSLLGPWPLVADVRQEQAQMASVRCPHNRTALQTALKRQGRITRSTDFAPGLGSAGQFSSDLGLAGLPRAFA